MVHFKCIFLNRFITFSLYIEIIVPAVFHYISTDYLNCNIDVIEPLDVDSRLQYRSTV